MTPAIVRKPMMKRREASHDTAKSGFPKPRGSLYTSQICRAYRCEVDECEGLNPDRVAQEQSEEVVKQEHLLDRVDHGVSPISTDWVHCALHFEGVEDEGAHEDDNGGQEDVAHVGDSGANVVEDDHRGEA